MPEFAPPNESDEADPLPPPAPLGLLLQAPRAAFNPFRLAAASVGLLLLQVGWAVLDRLSPSSLEVSSSVFPISVGPSWKPDVFLAPSWAVLREAGWRLTEPVRVLAVPLSALVTPGKGVSWFLHSLLAIAWAATVWGILGGAIARSFLLERARARSTRHLSPLRFAIRFASPLIAAPLYPLLVSLMLAAGCAAFGVVTRLPMGIGDLLGRALFFVPLVLGVGMAILRLAMVAVWPLIHAAIAADAEREIDALGRCLGYLNHRSGKLAGFLALAWAIGVPGLLAMELLAGVVMHLGTWGVGLTAPGPIEVPAFWSGAVQLVSQSWSYAYYWSMASCIYLMLRRDVDGTALTALAAGEEASRSAAAEGGEGRMP